MDNKAKEILETLWEENCTRTEWDWDEDEQFVPDFLCKEDFFELMTEYFKRMAK